MSPWQMMFMAYTPRSDSAARGYDEFLRTIDNPFFNAQPGVHHYSNWKFVDEDRTDLGFNHFDFLLLTDDATPASVFDTTAVQEFSNEWTTEWGRNPTGPPADNCQVYLTISDAVSAPGWGPFVELAFDEEATQGEPWRVTDQLLGQAPFKSFTRHFRNTPGMTGSELWAQLIAEP